MSSAKRKFLHCLQVHQTLFSLRRCWRGWERADVVGALQLWFENILLRCWHGRQRQSPCCRGILWFWSGCESCCTASWLPTKPHAKLCQTPYWSPRRHGNGFADVAGISRRVFIDWKCAQLCSFLLWSLPVLLWWSSQLVASVYSGGFLASAWVAAQADGMVVLVWL